MRNSPLLDRLFPAVILIMTLCCASCTRTQPPRPESPAGPTAAAASPTPTNSKELVSEDPKEQYLAIKHAFEEVLPSEPRETEEMDGNIFDLYSCSVGTDYLGVTEEDPIAPLANLAYQVVQLTKSLQTLGYPESQWKPLLTEFEREQLPLRISEMGKSYGGDESPSEILANAFGKRLIQKLNSYREMSDLGLPGVIYEGNCGAGEVGIHLALNPTDGRAFFIPVFFYKLCQKQSLDPHNQDQCNHWREPVSGLLLSVSGDYVYRVQWRDGTTKNGKLSFTDLEDGQTVTLSKN